MAVYRRLCVAEGVGWYLLLWNVDRSIVHPVVRGFSDGAGQGRGHREMVLLRRIGGGVYFRDGRGLMAWRVVVYGLHVVKGNRGLSYEVRMRDGLSHHGIRRDGM